MRAPFSFLKPKVSSFTLASLLPDFYFKASFVGMPWTPAAPGDTHGNLDTRGADDPIVGPAINGTALTPAQLSFPGTTGRSGFRSDAGTPSSSVITSTAWTILAFLRPLVLVASGGSYVADAGVCDSGGYWGMSLTRGVLQPQVGAGIDTGFVLTDGPYIPVSFPNTTIALSSNGVVLPAATIDVVSAAGADATGTILISTGAGPVLVAYTGVAGNTFTGCTGGAGEVLGVGNIVRTAGYLVAIMRYDGVSIRLRAIQRSGTVDTVPAASGAPFALGSRFHVGPTPLGGNSVSSHLAELATWKRVLSDAECDQLPAYFNATYNEALV